MACTTILVGKDASYDGSTIVARNEDSPSGVFNSKSFRVMNPKDQGTHYKSVLSKFEMDLPENPMRYTYMPNMEYHEGYWGTYGVNEKNVSMSATETITSNERVLGADPLVENGFGEEDMVNITLAYITSARHGVEYFGELLKKYGTYEMNGIAFQDENEIWWLETIGGHHFMARRVPDDSYVVMPNQLGIDYFDFEDAMGDKKDFICSEDLLEFIEENHLDLRMDKDEDFNPRDAFGSHADSDHTYNTPRAWAILRYLNPRSFTWDGMDADFRPEDDDLPWSLVPEHKITLEDVKWTMSNHYQGTPYDPYKKHLDPKNAGIYRPIGINRNNVLALVQIRPYVEEELKAIQWMALGSNVFNAMIPMFTNIEKTPEYLEKIYKTPSTENFYWANRIIGALADAHFAENSNNIERYQIEVNNGVYKMIKEIDKEFKEIENISVTEFFEKKNQEISDFVRKETDDLLDKVLYTSSNLMKNKYGRSDA